jgi:hypothetical protein
LTTLETTRSPNQLPDVEHHVRSSTVLEVENGEGNGNPSHLADMNFFLSLHRMTRAENLFSTQIFSYIYIYRKQVLEQIAI